MYRKETEKEPEKDLNTPGLSLKEQIEIAKRLKGKKKKEDVEDEEWFIQDSYQFKRIKRRIKSID